MKTLLNSMFASLLVLSATLLVSSVTGAEPAQRPNIIVILADDMGYSDIGCYGGEIKTPALDSLAAGGLRFTQFYNTARCCPTRACLLTGLYPHQAGVGHMMNDRKVEGYRGQLNRKCMTMAEVLKTAGYSTYMSGKWHVTPYLANNLTSPPKDNWPLQRGFDRFYGTIHGAGSFFDPNSLTRNNTYITPDNDLEYRPETYYYTDAISDNAVKYIREHDAKQPFFMYVAYTAAHWPMHALEKDIAKYHGVYDAGWDSIREARYKKTRLIGLINENCQLSPAVNAGWKNEAEKEWRVRCMEVYAAMVDSMDQGIGRITAELKRRGQFENTLVFYMQDNGGCAEKYGLRGNNGKNLKPRAPMAKDELQTLMTPRYTRAGLPVLTGHVMPGPATTSIGYDQPWANVSNTPFREYKHWVHEGGISTPLVVHWPAGISATDQLRRQPGHLIDIMATCVDVAGAKYPKQYKGQTIRPLEGRSLVPVFAGKQIEREFIFWEHEGNCAIRVGDWKLVRKGNQRTEKIENWELYDLLQDRSELNNLAAKNPELVQKLAEQWEAFALHAHAKPWPVAKKKTPPKKPNKPKKS
ncbi:MAG: arylsulfatase [Pirellulaceae bacterium]